MTRLTSIPGTDKLIVGQRKNFWLWSPSSGWDLTRPEWPESEPFPKPKPGFTLPCMTSNITVDPAKTALVVIDMQNCSFHQSLTGDPCPPNMLATQEALLQRAVPAARAAGIRVAWLNWGLTEEELAVIPPTNMRAFGWRRNKTKSSPQQPGYSTPDGSVRATNPETNAIFGLGEHHNLTHPGADLGTVALADGTKIDAGRFLMKNVWNTALYGPCLEAYQEGSKPSRDNKVPDVLLHKSRNSGLYDPSCEAYKYFQEQGIRTLIFTGVNTDQCVMGTLQDAHARGFDTIMLRDACATDSLGFAQDNAEYNCCISWGFLSTTHALAKAAGVATEDSSAALRNRWKSKQDNCVKNLQSISERKDALSPNSLERVESSIRRVGTSSRLAREFADMANSTQNLKTFIDRWLSQIVPNSDGCIIWGLYHLVIRDFYTEDNQARHIKVLGMLREVFEQSSHLNLVLERAFQLSDHHQSLCIEFACHIMEFLVSAKVFVDGTTNDIMGPRDEIAFVNEKKEVLQKLQDLTTRMDTANVLYMPTRSTQGSGDSSSLSWILSPSRRFESFSTGYCTPPPRHMSVVSSERVCEVAKLPCMVFPKTRAMNPHDRINEVKAIEDFFGKVYDDKDGEPSHRIMVLFGLGGTGKSTVALKYAEMKTKKKQLDAFLWVASETIVTLKQSVSNIALSLKLPDTKRGDDDANENAFTEWLGETMFDNVEDVNLIQNYLPFTSQCYFLVTTRNRISRTDLDCASLEVTAWDKDEGRKFLRTLLNINVKIDSEEDKSAAKLSMTLGGHAFAITTVAGIINRQSQSVSEFLAYFNEYKHDFYQEGGSTVKTICNISFQGLDRKSAIILGVMAYLEPDNIPLDIFEPPASTELPEELAGVIAKKYLSESLESLLVTNLVKRDSVEKKAYSLHRLVQQAFKERMTLEERQEAFNNATLLVSAAFPRHDSTNAQLYRKWEKCAICLPQVMRLKDAFNEERVLNKNFKPLFTFCGMNTFCQRYLLEKYAVEELESLLETNLLAMTMFPETQELISLMGNTTSHKGQLLVKTGRIEEGLKWLQQSYHYFCIEVPCNTRECGWAADNAADGYDTANQGEVASKWHKKARNHFIEWSSKDSDYAFECPSALITGSAVNKAWRGKLPEARAEINKAQRQIELQEKVNYDWAVAAWVRFALATIAFLEKNYDEAKQCFMQTQNIWLDGEQASRHPINGSCKYRLGCIALEQGELAAAINYLRDAVVLTKPKKKHMVGEYMRCIFKLSEALEQDPGRGDEAKQLREEAENLLHERFPNNSEDPGKGETYDRLVCISWR